MIRMTVTLDEKVVDEARDLLKAKTKRETIETALKEVIKQKKLILVLKPLHWIGVKADLYPLNFH